MTETEIIRLIKQIGGPAIVGLLFIVIGLFIGILVHTHKRKDIKDD